MKKLMIVPALALGMLFTTNANAQVEDNMKKAPTEANSQQEYVKIDKSEVPELVVAAVARDFKGSTIAEAYKAEDNTFKLVLVNAAGEKGMVFADATGKWIKPAK